MPDKNAFDPVIREIAEYVISPRIFSKETIDTARYCFMDSLGCALLALNYPQCTKLLGPTVPGATLHKGARVFGTNFELDPVQAAFNIGTMVRWLDYNDTWLAAEWGHPSDNLGAIWGVADYMSRREKNYKMNDILYAMVKAHEVQGVLALENSFNRVGLDHVLLVRIASTALSCKLLGLNIEQTCNAISQAWADGGALRTYRHAPNTGSRKSWAAGDAGARAVFHALQTMKGEMGYSTVLSANDWGFEDVILKGNKITLPQKLHSYVMDNVLFKISYPAEFHAQTAVEAALQLHSQAAKKFDLIEKIELFTQESGFRIINKSGPLNNPAARDHCLQYMVAVALIYGDLTADHYENDIAANPQIEHLRQLMVCHEDPAYSKSYLNPEKRSIANAVQIHYSDGSSSNKIEIHYPVGHRRRRHEGMPLLQSKFEQNIATRFDDEKCQRIIDLFQDTQRFDNYTVSDFSDLLSSKDDLK